ncbi:hypothetical protein C8A00DRAFT_38729 [Chaetomidium leptoderma]|uniref:DUF8212 domain-containing protein n=1 Tax=Chaetomidium leptoderma TaxID=669021 RepID=A0AAN6VC24_9PEZI|nr:hypothetical protein C8A00DRAFT_38729 [Chaetomidium leptoderma]
MGMGRLRKSEGRKYQRPARTLTATPKREHDMRDITRISASYFTAGDLTQFSAAQKMSWAAERETTRLEDAAYSLLGLFDINMPLVYGEGERAFQRLQEEILRQSEDDSLFAHRDSDVLAKWPSSFEHFTDATLLGDARLYRKNYALLNRNLSINRARIIMTFPAAQINSTGRPTSSLVLVLNYGTPEAASTLVLREDKPGIWSKMYVLIGDEALAALWSRRIKNRTVSIARAKRGGDRVWEWRQAYAGVNTVMIVRPPPGLAAGLVTAQDLLRDNIVVKGPGETSGFKAQYVYAVRFQARLLGRSDEVHLIPIYGEDQGQS